jgi:hypothetical protein
MKHIKKFIAASTLLLLLISFVVPTTPHNNRPKNDGTVTIQSDMPEVEERS